MEDIIIAGISINELKKQKQAIQKDAAKFIADALEEVKALVSKIVEAEDIKDTDALAKKAEELLDSVGVVSGVSGVEYYLDYNSEYESGDDVLTTKLEAAMEETGLPWEEQRLLAVSSLIGTLEDMEYESRQWNQSNC